MASIRLTKENFKKGMQVIDVYILLKLVNYDLNSSNVLHIKRNIFAKKKWDIIVIIIIIDIGIVYISYYCLFRLYISLKYIL